MARAACGAGEPRRALRPADPAPRRAGAAPGRAMHRRLESRSQRLRWLQGRAAVASPAARVRRQLAALADMRQRLSRCLRHTQNIRVAQFRECQSRFWQASPLARVRDAAARHAALEARLQAAGLECVGRGARAAVSAGAHAARGEPAGDARARLRHSQRRTRSNPAQRRRCTGGHLDRRPARARPHPRQGPGPVTANRALVAVALFPRGCARREAWNCRARAPSPAASSCCGSRRPATSPRGSRPTGIGPSSFATAMPGSPWSGFPCPHRSATCRSRCTRPPARTRSTSRSSTSATSPSRSRWRRDRSICPPRISSE